MVDPFSTQSRVDEAVPMKKKDSTTSKIKSYVSSKVKAIKNADYKAGVKYIAGKTKSIVTTQVKKLPERYNKVEKYTSKAVSRLGSDITKSFVAKDINKVNKKIGTAVAREFAPTKLTSAQIQAFRKAKAARLQAEQYQRTTSIQASGFDNKFERQLSVDKSIMDEEERRRRFHETPQDFLLRRDALEQLRHQRIREHIDRNNLLKAHETLPKIHLNFLGVDSVTNLARSTPIWRQDNPDNNVFRDTGRPTILDTPNRFQQTDLTRSMNILNAPRLNFGKIDTTRKKRIPIQYRPEDSF